MDIRTLTVLSVAIILGFGVALGIFGRVNARRTGVCWFAAAFVSLAAGLFLLGLRDLAPDLVTVIAANFLLAVGFVGLWRGARAFAGASAQPRIEAALLAVFVAGMAFFTYVHPDVRARIVVFSFMSGSTSALALRDSIRFARASAGRAAGVLVTVFAVFTVYSAARAIGTWQGGAISDFMLASNFQASAFLVLLFGSAALAFATLWATMAQIAGELSAANRGLTRSNEQLERFARVVSHDLRAPLATARGYVDLLLGRHGDELPAKPRGYAEEIGAAMDRCMALVDDVLFLSRLKSDIPARERVSLAGACAEAIGNLSVTIERDAASIEVGQLPDIVGAYGQIVRLFQNLIGNAIRYRHRDRAPKIRVDSAAHRGAWRIFITDNGQGFDRGGGRAPAGSAPTAAAHPESTGLGLSICRQIVENHGGSLWIESAAGSGTTVSFTLPASAAPDAPHDPLAVRAISATALSSKSR